MIQSFLAISLQYLRTRSKLFEKTDKFIFKLTWFLLRSCYNPLHSKKTIFADKSSHVNEIHVIQWNIHARNNSANKYWKEHWRIQFLSTSSSIRIKPIQFTIHANVFARIIYLEPLIWLVRKRAKKYSDKNVQFFCDNYPVCKFFSKWPAQKQTFPIHLHPQSIFKAIKNPFPELKTHSSSSSLSN